MTDNLDDWLRRENGRLQSEVTALRQALWDTYVVLVGDSDVGPVAVVNNLGVLVTEAAEKWRKDRDEEVEEYDQILGRQTELLRGVANALKGDPPPLTWHDHSDLPQRTERLVRDLEDVLKLLRRYDMHGAVDDFLALRDYPFAPTPHAAGDNRSAEPQPHQPPSPDATTNQTSHDHP